MIVAKARSYRVSTTHQAPVDSMLYTHCLILTTLRTGSIMNSTLQWRLKEVK